MHNLTEFLAKYKHWFLFVALIVIESEQENHTQDFQGNEQEPMLVLSKELSQIVHER